MERKQSISHNEVYYDSKVEIYYSIILKLELAKPLKLISELKIHWNDEWLDKYVRSLGETIKQKKISRTK